MKQYISILTAGLLAATFTGCVDTDKPVFHPVDGSDVAFTINTPAMQDQYIQTVGDMADKSSFMLYASQPDYGFATKCTYGVQVSLDNTWVDAVVDDNGSMTQRASYVALSNQDPSSGAMRFKTYDLAVAMCELLGITVNRDNTLSPGKDPDWDPIAKWNEYIADGGATEMPVYFRATCEIPGVPGSFVTSSNTTTYNKVGLVYAIAKPGKIFMVGDPTGWTIANDPTSEFDTGLAFNEPGEKNADFYSNYALEEPEIGCKVYVGSFWMPATETCHAGAEGNNYNTQWRYFTELVGWDKTAYEIASKLDNFWVEPISDKFDDGWNNGSMCKLNAVYGDGNFGINLTEAKSMTHVVSLEVSDKPVVWLKVGQWNVTLGVDGQGMKEPVFTAPEE